MCNLSFCATAESANIPQKATSQDDPNKCKLFPAENNKAEKTSW